MNIKLNNEVEANFILKDRTFKVKFLNLPKLIQLNVSMEQDITEMLSESSFSEINKQNMDSNIKPTFILDYARFEDFQVCHEFVKEAANVGDNVGEDEFENDELLQILNISEVFVIKSSGNRTDSIGNILVFIILQPYWARVIDTCQTMVSIYYDQNWFNTSAVWSKNENFKKEILYATLTSLAVKLAEDIQIGYTDALVKMCSINFDRLSILQNIGFRVVACIPNGISINGNLENDFLMMKSFAPTRMPRPMEEVARETQGWCERDEADKVFDVTSLLKVPFFPLKFKTKNGTIILVRTAEKSDMRMLYNLFQEAMSEGDGYGSSEYPTFSFFKVSLLASYNIVYEIYDELNVNSSSSRVIGCSLILPSLKIRSKRSQASESAIVISKQFRSQGFGKELLLFERYLIRKLGFKLIVNEFLECNTQLRKVLEIMSGKAKDRTIGFIPRSSFNIKYGWEGQIVCFVDLQNPDLDCVFKKIEKAIRRISVSKL